MNWPKASKISGKLSAVIFVVMCIFGVTDAAVEPRNEALHLVFYICLCLFAITFLFWAWTIGTGRDNGQNKEEIDPNTSSANYLWVNEVARLDEAMAYDPSAEEDILDALAMCDAYGCEIDKWLQAEQQFDGLIDAETKYTCNELLKKSMNLELFVVNYHIDEEKQNGSKDIK